MKYLIKSSALFTYEDNKMIARIRGHLFSDKENVSMQDNDRHYIANITMADLSPDSICDVHNREYTLKCGDETLMSAHPGYADDGHPDPDCWHAYGAQKVDHANVTVCSSDYVLLRQSSKKFALQTDGGETVLHIDYNKASHGWTLDPSAEFDPLQLCGFYIFSRYLEQENQLMTAHA